MIEWLWPWLLLLAPLPWLLRRVLPPASGQEPALRAPFFDRWQQLSYTQGTAGASSPSDQLLGLRQVVLDILCRGQLDDAGDPAFSAPGL